MCPAGSQMRVVARLVASRSNAAPTFARRIAIDRESAKTQRSLVSKLAARLRRFVAILALSPATRHTHAQKRSLVRPR